MSAETSFSNSSLEGVPLRFATHCPYRVPKSSSFSSFERAAGPGAVAPGVDEKGLSESEPFPAFKPFIFSRSSLLNSSLLLSDESSVLKKDGFFFSLSTFPAFLTLSSSSSSPSRFSSVATSASSSST